jgi:hypothetical protein
VLAILVPHPAWGVLALPLRARLYIRRKDLDRLERDRCPDFATKLEMAVERMRWARVWLRVLGKPLWVVADGAYAKATLLKPMTAIGVVVVSRLRKDSALYTLPDPRPAGRRGRPRVYGERRIDLAKRAGQRRGWLRGTFVLYGKAVVKRYKTFVATWRPAAGMIRVVLVDEPDGWRAFFCTDPQAAVADILGLVADRFRLEKSQADYPSRRRWVGTERSGYHRRNGVARVGRVVPATPRRSRWSRSMSDPSGTPVPPRAGSGPARRRCGLTCPRIGRRNSANCSANCSPGSTRPTPARRPAVSELLRSAKLRPWHLDRVAIVYVRQSTPQQVLHHQESTARPYALAERAVALGWTPDRVVTIDDDRGQSGSSIEGRPGFQRLLAEVALDRVGLILGLEMSRLARSCRDWHQLLEWCGRYRVLLADADGIDDPTEHSDRLLLGLQNSYS